MILKKGDPALPSNYRPIAILPILHKVFRRIVCTRITGGLIAEQSVKQAAYRKGFSTEDHLLALTLLIERTIEWRFDLWIVLIDFKKAFDTVEHEALWVALEEQLVDPA